jgi:hypothetical protein
MQQDATVGNKDILYMSGFKGFFILIATRCSSAVVAPAGIESPYRMGFSEALRSCPNIQPNILVASSSTIEWSRL